MDSQQTVLKRDDQVADTGNDRGIVPAGATGNRSQGASRRVNAMTVDVEDYFQVGAFAAVVKRSDWDGLVGRVEQNTQKILEIFDEAGIRGTFFTLGWVAERHPRLVRQIAEQGHELASHGYDHRPAFSQTADEFRADIGRTRQMLEDISGVPVHGYRAPSFSIDMTIPWVYEVLAEEGYRYSSSVYPVQHDHYGMPDAPRFVYRPDQNAGIVEIPLSTVRLFGHNFPSAGGGYFRLVPYALYRRMLRRVNGTDGQPGIFYFHPWEIDPAQPRQIGLSAKSRFRHYVNIHTMQARLQMLLADFAWDRVDRVFVAHIEGPPCAPETTTR